MFPEGCLIKGLSVEGNPVKLSFEGKDIEHGGMMLNKEGKRIVSVKFVFDAGPPGPKTDRYETDEIPVESVDMDPSVGGTIVVNGSGEVHKLLKGVGRKSSRGPRVGTVNVGKAVYISK